MISTAARDISRAAEMAESGICARGLPKCVHETTLGESTS